MDNYKAYGSIEKKLYSIMILAIVAVFIIMYNINVDTTGRGFNNLELYFDDSDINYNIQVDYLNYPEEITINYSEDYEYNTFYEDHEQIPNIIIKLAKIVEEFSTEEIFRAPVITHNKIFDTVLGLFTIPINIIWSLAKLMTRALKITGAYPDYEGTATSTIDAIFIRGKSNFTYGSSYGGGGGGGQSR